MGPTPPDFDFEEWYKLHYERIFRSVAMMTRDASRAKDSVDEALVRALERWSRVSTMVSPVGWVIRVAVNDYRRKNRRRMIESRLWRLTQPGSRSQEPSYDGIGDFMRHLSARQREVLVLRFVSDLTETQIGSVLGISRSTVSSTLRDSYRLIAEVSTIEVPTT